VLVSLPLIRYSISPTLFEWRIAGLILSGTCVILILLRPKIKSPLLESLVTLRREIGLGKNFNDILERTIIALEGLSIPDIMQKELGN